MPFPPCASGRDIPGPGGRPACDVRCRCGRLVAWIVGLDRPIGIGIGIAWRAAPAAGPTARFSYYYCCCYYYYYYYYYFFFFWPVQYSTPLPLCLRTQTGPMRSS